MTLATLSTTHDKRRRRTNAEIDDMRAVMLAILEQDHPQSVRHVFYRMTDPRLSCAVEKSERGYRHVQYQLAEMRKEGLLPYGWIVDATRTGYFVNTFDDAADFVSRVSGTYRADLWKSSEVYIEAWVESRSIAGVIKPICTEFCVPLYPAGGFASLTLSYEAAAYIQDQVAGTAREVHILYIGDYDPAGVLIDRDIEGKLRGHLRCSNPLEFHRLAINPEQIYRLDLPTKPRKDGDRRSLHITETVEAEAMPAGMLRQLLREEIESFLPEGALKATRIAEQSERDFLRRMAQVLAGQGGGA